MTIPAEHADLVGPPHYAHLVTINRDGSPQSTVVWIERQGDEVVFNTGAGSRKARNIERDPRVAVSIHEVANPYRALELRGGGSLAPAGGYDLLDRLAGGYLGLDEYPYDKSSEDGGIEVRIRPERVVAHGSSGGWPASQPVPDDTADVFCPPHFGHIATVTPSGQPCSAPLWVDTDGDEVVFWTTANSLKIRNLEANPAIAISAHDEANPLRYAEVRGTAELTPVGHADLLDSLARRYWQVDEYPDKSPGLGGVEVRVRVEHRVDFDGR